MNKDQLPLTLRQLSGLSEEPAPLSESVVLVIDAQKEYTEGKLPLSGIEASVDKLAKLIERARKLKVPVIHIVHKGKSGSVAFDQDTRYFEIIDKVKPIENETIVEKTLPSSFKNTDLNLILEKIGRKNLVITGYMTHMCVNSTTRDAAELGYNCVVIEELTATRDLPDGKGGIIPADVVKSANLAALRDRFAIIVENAENLQD